MIGSFQLFIPVSTDEILCQCCFVSLFGSSPLRIAQCISSQPLEYEFVVPLNLAPVVVILLLVVP